ncbi:MAG: transglutaminase-like cysteine peptidase [Pseudomonadota bacterium]
MNRRAFLRLSAGALSVAVATSLPAALVSGDKGPQAATLGELAENYQQGQKAIFGSREIASSSFAALPQWQKVLEKTDQDHWTIRGCNANDQQCQEPWAIAWRDLVEKARVLPKRARLDYINKSFNYWPYRFDQEVYGVNEYWASPSEFMRRSGDCEDYSIAKYFALRQVGFGKEEMRIVILYDQIRNIGHAVLAVYLADDILILDSLSDRIISHRKFRHYLPQYSMNESQRWAHVAV